MRRFFSEHKNSLHSGTIGAAWCLAYFSSKSQPSYIIRPCFACCRVDKNSNLESHDSNCIRDGSSLLCSGIFCGRCYAALSMATLPIDRLFVSSIWSFSSSSSFVCGKKHTPNNSRHFQRFEAPNNAILVSDVIHS